MHVFFLVPAEKHHRYVQRTSVTHFQRLYDRVFGIVVFLYGKDTRRLTLKFRADMSPKFDAVRHEVQYADNTSIVYPCQAVKFVNNGYTFRFIVRRTYQISNTINDNEVYSTMLVMEQVHTFTDKFQAVLTRE